MKGLKLIRRMELAGLIRYAPEDGKPIVLFEGGRFYRFWTEGVYLNDGASLWHFDTPDDLFPSMGYNLSVLKRHRDCLA